MSRRLTLRELKDIVREALELNEIFGLSQQRSFEKSLDDIVDDMYRTTQKLERAHQLAPGGTAKAIVAGLYNDAFNQLSEFRKYVQELKSLSKSL